jgi:hypothetical protein
MAKEALLQSKCLAHARGLPNTFATKIEKCSDVGFPDAFVTSDRSGPFVVEFKSPGIKPRPNQVVMHATLKRCGLRVWVCDSWESWMAICKETMLL